MKTYRSLGVGRQMDGAMFASPAIDGRDSPTSSCKNDKSDVEMVKDI